MVYPAQAWDEMALTRARRIMKRERVMSQHMLESKISEAGPGGPPALGTVAAPPGPLNMRAEPTHVTNAKKALLHEGMGRAIDVVVNGTLIKGTPDHVLVVAGELVIVEDKNKRAWLHPTSYEVWQLLTRCLETNGAVLPVLVARKVSPAMLVFFAALGAYAGPQPARRPGDHGGGRRCQ